jgi:hypothetical protein
MDTPKRPWCSAPPCAPCARASLFTPRSKRRRGSRLTLESTSRCKTRVQQLILCPWEERSSGHHWTRRCCAKVTLPAGAASLARPIPTRQERARRWPGASAGERVKGSSFASCTGVGQFSLAVSGRPLPCRKSRARAFTRLRTVWPGARRAASQRLVRAKCQPALGADHALSCPLSDPHFDMKSPTTGR